MLDLHRKRKRQKEGENLLALLPQGEGSGLNADLLDGLHAREIIDKVTYKAPSGPTFGGGGGGLTQHGNEFHTPDFSEVTHNHNLNDLLEKNHVSLANVTANQHHNQNHNLASTDHPDVSIVGPANTEVLTYETATSLWKNKAAPAGGDTDRTATKTVGFTAEADYFCDGVADDVQINAAILAVSGLGGGSVILQRGTFKIAVSINMKSKVALRGQSIGGTMLQTSAAVICIAAANSEHYLAISDMWIDGNNVGTRGISLGTLNDVWVTNVIIAYFTAYGIYCNVTSVLVANGIFIYSCVIGIYGNIAQNCIITNSVFSQNSNVAMSFVTNSFLSTIANNDIITSSVASGIFISAGFLFSVTSNFFLLQGTGYGVRLLAAAEKIVVANNSFRVDGVNASPIIDVDASKTAMITGNVISMKDGTGIGIKVGNTSTNVGVVDNVIYIID